VLEISPRVSEGPPSPPGTPSQDRQLDDAGSPRQRWRAPRFQAKARLLQKRFVPFRHLAVLLRFFLRTGQRREEKREPSSRRSMAGYQLRALCA